MTNRAREIAQRPLSWVPGEMLVSARVALRPETDPLSVLAELRERVVKTLGDIPVAEPEHAQAPLLLPTGQGRRSILFGHFTLASPEPRVMKRAISRLNANVSEQQRASASGVDAIAATPNWFGAAQQVCDGGSPASQPVPASPFGARVRYAPQLRALDLVERATARGEALPTVAVLDTAPQRTDVDRALQQFPYNRHLHELVENLAAPFGAFEPSPIETERQLAMQQVEAHGGFHAVEMGEPYDVRDHGLFVAGVVHAAAPWAHLRLVRVLNDFGVGSLHSLVIGLVGLMQAKAARDPLVINLSLGILPALEQLASIWFGLPIEGLRDCPEDAGLQFVADRQVPKDELRALIKRNDAQITGPLERLRAPVTHLIEAVRANNCLVVAAAGNDSVFDGVERRPRWGPRLPALSDDVLGVAADTIRPSVPARYSNRGETPSAAVRDAVATLGGDLAPDGVSPVGGVIGVYTAEQFPTTNANGAGWAEWAGTSFATPIMSGVAANLWATRPKARVDTILRDFNAAARAGGRSDVADLGVPSVPVRFSWLP